MTGRVLTYLDDFADEVAPSALESSTPEGWAKWLAGGGERADPDHDPESCWGFDPPVDGAEYAASTLTFEDDVIATRSGDGETVRYSRPIPADVDFIAVRFAPGLGWDADSIICDVGDLDRTLVEDLFMEKGESYDLAVGRSAQLRLRYCAGPPPSLAPLQSGTLERTP